MEPNEYFKSIIDQDKAPIVICDLNHTIVYMNQSAIARYSKQGGDKLVGQSLLICHNAISRDKIQQTINWFKKSVVNNTIYESYNEKENKDVYMVALRDENKNLIGYYEKHEYRNNETSKFYDFSNDN